MTTKQRFASLRQLDTLREEDPAARGKRLTQVLTDRVVTRFEKISGSKNAAAAIYFSPPSLLPEDGAKADGLPPRGTHECARCWNEVAGDIQDGAGPQWRECTTGPLCGMVPIVWNDWCVAGCKIVSSPDEANEFKRDLELLHILVENFVAHEPELLTACCTQPDVAQSCHADGTETGSGRPNHPQLMRAVSYIKAHLADTDLTVAGIAERLKMNATYLAHLFSTRMGVRMSRFIAKQRIDLAKQLLATTQWQIKRISYECGYANPDWFSHVFHDYVGCPPGEYRRRNAAKRPN